MMKKGFCLVLCAVLLFCLGAGAESVEDSIVLGMISYKTYEIRPLNPLEREMVSVYNEVYESLVYIDDDGLPQPKLAESWETTNGGKTWTFTLRDDVVFSDGTPLTARDVAASGSWILNLAEDENAEDHGFYANIKYMVTSFEAKDDYTLVVKAERDYYGLLYSMTFPVVKESEVDTANPVGTGPYVISSFTPGSYLFLDMNEKWWQNKPQVKTISINLYPNNNEMISAYEYGKVDAVFTRSVSSSQYKSGIKALSISYSTRQLEVLMLNNRSRSFPLDNANVRKAVRYAINVDLISSNVYMGMTSKANTPVPSDSWLYLDQESSFVYNPEKAAQILEEEGWSDLDGNGILDYPVEGAEEPKHLVLSLYVYEDPENDVRSETAEDIKTMLESIGFSIHIETVTYAKAKEVLEAGSYDMMLCAFQMDVVPDYGFFLRKGNSQNYARYSSSDMTSLIDTLRTQELQSDFYSTTQLIQQKFAEDVPFICLFYRTGAILTRKMFTNVRSIREFELLRGIESFKK